MTGRSATVVLFAFLITIGSSAMTHGASSEKQSSAPAEFIKVGTYWEYAYEYERFDSIFYNGNITMEVASEEQRVVSGDMASIYTIDLVGTGVTSGDWFGDPVTGTTDFTGEEVRLTSNFSLVSEHMLMSEYMNYTSGELSATSCADIAYEPVLDDVIGDTELTINSNFTTMSEMTIEQWINESGNNETQNAQNQTSLTFMLIYQNNPVVTPAGSFLCDVYLVTFQSEENELKALWYYSEKVGNYVKSEGAFSWIFSMQPFTNLELRSYSYSTDNVPPEADAGQDQTVEVGDTVTLDGSASSDDVGIVTYKWTFTDAIEMNLSGEVAQHAFASEGTYVVNLTVTDQAGNSDWDTMNVTVKKGTSFLSTNAILIGVAAAVVVVAVVAVLLLRKRKGKGASETPDSFVFTVPPE